MSSASGLAAVARGTIAETPVMHLLLYLYRKGANGTLVLQTAQLGAARISFRNGRPNAALFDDGSDKLLSGLSSLSGQSEGSYEFFSEDLIGKDPAAVRGAVDPYALLMVSLREHPRDDVVEEVMARYEGVALRMQPRSDVARLRLRPEEQNVIEVLRAAPADATTLAQQAPLPNRRATRVLYALLVTHMLAPHHEAQAEAEPPTRTPPANTKQPTATQSDSGTRPRVTSPPSRRPRTDSEPIRSVLPIPDRPRSRQPTVSKHPGTLTFNSMNAVAGPPMSAWQRLASLRPDAHPRMARRTESFLPPNATSEQRIEHAAKMIERNKYQDALDALAPVLAEKADHADALALKAHAMLGALPDRSRGLPKEIMETVRRALRTDPDQPRAMLVKGLIYKEAGEHRKAINCFKRAIAEDPKNLVAQRELRLAKMRADS